MNSSPDHRSSSVMGYPSLNGFPNGQGKAPPPPYPVPYQGGAGYASPYQSYPNHPPTANPKDFSSQSFNMWYNSDTYGQWTPEPTNSQKFARLMFATMVTLLISLCMVSLVVWLLFGTDVPDFEVASFSVSNLTISGSMIEASWAVNMTVTNPNSELKIKSGSIKASILYKDYPLVTSSLDPSHTQGQNQRQKQVNLYFKMEHGKSICKDELAKEITEAKKAGSLILSLRFGAGSKFTSRSGWTQKSLRIFCEDLKLSITPEGDGKLAQDSPKGCLIFT